MSSIILPYKYPIITSWSWHANLLSILACYPESDEWIFSNYLHSFIHDDDRLERRLFLDFWPMDIITNHCPYINAQIVKRETLSLSTEESVLSFFRNMLNLKQYIYGVFDMSFLTGRNFMHEMCIYGYDDEIQSFLCADFMLGENGKFTFKNVSYKDIVDAYLKSSDADDFLYRGRGGLQMLSHFDKREYTFSILQFITSINDYLTEKNMFDYIWNDENSRDDYRFGMSVYSEMLRRIRDESTSIDIRVLSNLSDHKKMLYHRELYFKDRLKLKITRDYGFERLYTISQSVLSRKIKEHISGKLYTDNIKDSLTAMQKIEYDALSFLRDDLITLM